MSDQRQDFASTLARGYRHGAIRFTRWRDDHPRVGERVNEVYRVERHQQEARQFVVARETLPSGGAWWHVYRRLNPNDRGHEWRWVSQHPNELEAAEFIDDLLVGRTRVAFGGVRFKLKKAEGRTGQAEPSDPRTPDPT